MTFFLCLNLVDTIDLDPKWRGDVIGAEDRLCHIVRKRTGGKEYRGVKMSGKERVERVKRKRTSESTIAVSLELLQ